MTEQLTILLVVIPLIVAPIIALFKRHSIAWALSTLVCLSCLVISIYILTNVLGGEHVIYELGGWRPPWGIEYKIDSLNAFVALIVSGIATLSMIYALQSVPKEIEAHNYGLFYSAFTLCLLGLLGIALTGDIFNLFVFLEISSLSSYALIAMGKSRRALKASFSYLILGTIGATFFLIGVGFLFAASGSLNMSDLANRFSNFENMHLVMSGFIFILLGLALKAAIYPLHSWLPESYTQAPSVVSVFLSATATKVSIYALMRVLFDIYPIEYWVSIFLPHLLLILGSIAAIYGSYRAWQQNDLKRLLAFSSVAQIGYIVIGIGLISESSLYASTLHLFNHAIIKASLFMAAGLFLYRANTTDLRELKGFAWIMPYTFTAMVLAGLSLIGVPGTVGFITKWYLLEAAIEQGHYAVVTAVLISSLLAIAYVWKIVEAMYFSSEGKAHLHNVKSGDAELVKSPLSLQIALWIGALACIFFGLYTSLPFESAQSITRSLLSLTTIQ